LIAGTRAALGYTSTLEDRRASQRVEGLAEALTLVSRFRTAWYLSIGALSVVVDVGLLVVLREVTAIPLGVCAAIAFAASLLVNFTLNRRVFADLPSGNLHRHTVRYAVLVLANWAVTVLVVTGAAAVKIPYIVGKLAVITACAVWNFALYRKWVFT
jgi:putative flippase GtrA